MMIVVLSTSTPSVAAAAGGRLQPVSVAWRDRLSSANIISSTCRCEERIASNARPMRAVQHKPVWCAQLERQGL